MITKITKFLRGNNPTYVAASTFNVPNNYALKPCYRPQYAVTDSQPNIQYIHTVKSLLNTIDRVTFYTSHPTLSDLAKKELKILNQHRDNYYKFIILFVQRGGLLTAQGIGNLYYSAEKLAIKGEWLQKYVHPYIQGKISYMNHHNLVDTLAGLQKYHPTSPIINKVKQQLSKKPKVTYTYVAFQANSINKFIEEVACSNNLFLRLAYQNQKGNIVKQKVTNLKRIISNLLNRNQYALDSQY